MSYSLFHPTLKVHFISIRESIIRNVWRVGSGRLKPQVFFFDAFIKIFLYKRVYWKTIKFNFPPFLVVISLLLFRFLPFFSFLSFPLVSSPLKASIEFPIKFQTSTISNFFSFFLQTISSLSLSSTSILYFVLLHTPFCASFSSLTHSFARGKK